MFSNSCGQVSYFDLTLEPLSEGDALEGLSSVVCPMWEGGDGCIAEVLKVTAGLLSIS
jgi:hypothetical protein